MVSPVSKRVALRFKATTEMPKPGKWTIRELEQWYAKLPKPKSTYDKLSEAIRPFGWSTPAPVVEGEMPMPWRVAHADRARDLLKRLFPKFTDTYIDYNDRYRGRLTLWIGLRDNRDHEDHSARLGELAEGLRKEGFEVLFKNQGGSPTLYLVDDLPEHVLKS